MPKHNLYDYFSKPSGILRALIVIGIIIFASAAWGTHSLEIWFNNVALYAIWVIPAFICWLLLLFITKYILQFFTQKNPSALTRPATYYIATKAWPVCLGMICAGFFAGFGVMFQTTPEYFWKLNKFWDWPAAIWGAIITVTIVEWFTLFSKGQDPANTQAKLLELQARIRPHFLFNTLNSAIALVRLDPDAAENVLQNLAKLFRVALESGNRNETTLQEEADLAKSYLSIEAIRLRERLHTIWQLNDKTLNMLLPQLTLQPLVENAIRHGIEPCAQPGQIIITSSTSLGKLYLTVSNTIRNTHEQTQTSVSTNGHGIALKNLRERIYLMYDFEGILHTKTHQDDQGQNWFKATVEIPAHLSQP